MSTSEQFKLLQQSLDDFGKSDFAAFGDKFAEDFHRETLPSAIGPMANEKSKTEFLTKMEGFRRGIFKDPFKMEVREYVEQPGSLMAFVHETCTTVWGETFETDVVILATFRTDEDGKLRITSFKQFLDGFHVTKMGDALKANGIVMPNA